MLKAQDVQHAFERLMYTQDQDTVDATLRGIVPVPAGHYLETAILRADHDAIQVGPVVDIGDNTYQMLVTVQVEMTVKPE